VAKKVKNEVEVVVPEVWNGVERRTSLYNATDEKRRSEDKVSANFVSTKNDERYQFEHLVIYYRARFNVWQVVNMNLPSYEQLLFEVAGYANQMDAFMWAKEYIKRKKYGEENKENE